MTEGHEGIIEQSGGVIRPVEAARPVEKKPFIEAANVQLRSEVVGLVVDGEVGPLELIDLVSLSVDYKKATTEPTGEIDLARHVANLQVYADEHITVYTDAIAAQREQTGFHKTVDQGEVVMATNALKVLRAVEKKLMAAPQ